MSAKVVYQGNDLIGYTAEIKEFPGCTVRGETLEQAINLADAMLRHFNLLPGTVEHEFEEVDKTNNRYRRLSLRYGPLGLKSWLNHQIHSAS